MNHEQLLRDTLAAKATEASVDLTFDEIMRSAAAHRRRTLWRTAGGVAAAAAVLVGMPVALHLRVHETPSPAPSPSVSPSLSTSPTPTPSGLAAIPRGKDPAVTYLRDGVVHLAGGGTTRLPAAASDVATFTSYHGGWVVLDSVGGLVQYDNTGQVVQRSQGEPSLAVSADQLSTAYSADGTIHVGVTTGMGSSEVTYSVGSARLVGFARDPAGNDDLVFSGGGQVGYIRNGSRHVVPGLVLASASSSGSDLIGGVGPDRASGRVVDLAGHVRWTGAWLPDTFSPDGRYVAAVLAPDGEGTDVAILDARSGAVVSQVSLQRRGMVQFGPPAWEESDSAVLVEVKDSDNVAILRLGNDGELTRASEVLPATDQPTWAFATTP